MISKIVSGLALVLSSVLFGCVTQRPDPRDLLSASEPLHFKNYREAYAYVAHCEGLPTDADTLLKLAAESKMEITPVENLGTFHIIEASYYADGLDQIRGAQGNGRFYVLRENKGNFDLAGILEGNAYRWNNTDNHAALQTHWHVGGGDNDDWTDYSWNGQSFGAIAPTSLQTFYKPPSPARSNGN